MISSSWWTEPRLRFAVGIEDTFIPQVRDGERGLDEYELTQHYDNWEHDLELIAESGAGMVRYGIPWYRVNPAPGVWEWDWLDGVARKLQELGVAPIVDLMHYGTPLWLEKQFLHPDYPNRVAEYAHAVAERYAGMWRIYTPLNEPMLNALYCGLYAYWPPYASGERGLVALIRSLQRGIVAAQAAVKDAIGLDASFVHVEAAFRFEAESESDEGEAAFLRERAFIVQDLLMGMVSSDHPLTPFLLSNGFTDDDLEWSRSHLAVPDVMGVNYYPAGQTELVSRREPHSGGPGDLRPRINAWTDGLRDVLTTFATRYRRPVFLTETSTGGSPEEKEAWLRDSLRVVRELRDQGVDVVGYTWWSIIDMIEWTYRHGNESPDAYKLDMGLWALHADEDGRYRRVKTALADRFRAEALR